MRGPAALAEPTLEGVSQSFHVWGCGARARAGCLLGGVPGRGCLLILRAVDAAAAQQSVTLSRQAFNLPVALPQILLKLALTLAQLAAALAQLLLTLAQLAAELVLTLAQLAAELAQLGLALVVSAPLSN